MVSEHIKMYNFFLYPLNITHMGLESWSNQTGDKYYHLWNYSDSYLAYKDITSNGSQQVSYDIAGTPPRTGDSMITFQLTSDIEVVPGSFSCGSGCIDPVPSFPSKINSGNYGLRLEWKTPVARLRINESWEVTFKVRSYTSGRNVPINVVPQSGIRYDQWNGTPNGSNVFGQLTLTVFPPPPTVPSPPTGLTGVVDNSSIDLSWSAPSHSGRGIVPILRYKIYRGTIKNGETYLSTILGSETRHKDREIIPGNNYYYRVSAVNFVGEGPWSDELEVSVPIPPSVPSSPQSLTAVPIKGAVALEWEKPSTDGKRHVIFYSIYRGFVSGDVDLFASVDANETHFSDSSVIVNVRYYYRVSAVNSIGEGPQSDEASALVPTPTFVPGPPDHTSAVPNGGTIFFSWRAPSDGNSPILGYRVYRGLEPGSIEFLTSVGPGETAFSDESVVRDVTYYYAVSAFNAVGEGPMSEVAEASVPAEEPQRPIPHYYVHVTVRDAETEEPIAFATIKFGIDRGTFSSDEWGHALITDTSPGRRRLSLTADGYEPVLGYLAINSPDSNVTLYMNRKAVESAGGRPPQTDAFSLSVLFLAVLLAEIAFFVIAYSKVSRSKRLDGRGRYS